MKKKIPVFLIFFSFLIIITALYKHKNTIFQKYDPQIYEKKYFNSQWIIPDSKTPISDEDLYAYAGYRYVKGENPILLNPEVPPLGKYIIGLSILIFKNPRILAIILAFLSLILIFFITYELSKSFFSASVSIFLTSINSIFLDQIIHSLQLEIYQLFLLLLFILFFNFYLKKKKIFYLSFSGILFGGFISIKFFLYHFILFNLWLILFFLIKRKKEEWYQNIKTIFFLNLIAFITFTITYFNFFMKGNNFYDFLKTQKWIFLFYQQSEINQFKTMGSYLTLILFNKWRYWTPGYPFIKYDNWSILWPIIFLFGIFSLFKLIKRNKIHQIKNLIILNLLFSFFIIYNFFLFFTPIYPRYLLLLFLPLGIFASLYIEKFVWKR